MTTTNNDRLVITWQKDTSATEALSFTSVAQVAAQYGWVSAEAAIARSYFPAFPGNTLTFIRYGIGQRPHVIGGNIDTLTLAGLQQINGTLDIQLSITGGPTFDYAGTVDMASAQSFTDAAQLIVGALDANLPIAARTTGDTLVAHNISFQGYVDPAHTSHLFVTALDGAGDPVIPGGIVAGLNIASGAQIISQLNGTPGGIGEYDLFSFKGGTSGLPAQTTNPLTNSGVILESYGLLDVGSVTAGQMSVGERIQPTTGNGIPALTAIAARAPDGQNWIVNHAVNASGSLTMTAPGLTVQQHAVVGTRTGAITNEFFDIQPDGHYGYNQIGSSMTLATGTAADALGLSALSGAILSSPGGANFSIAGYMSHIISLYTNQYGQPISFGSFMSEEPRLDPFFTAWTQTPAGTGYVYIPHNPPVAATGTLVHTTADAFGSVGHGPG